MAENSSEFKFKWLCLRKRCQEKQLEKFLESFKNTTKEKVNDILGECDIKKIHEIQKFRKNLAKLMNEFFNDKEVPLLNNIDKKFKKLLNNSSLKEETQSIVISDNWKKHLQSSENYKYWDKFNFFLSRLKKLEIKKETQEDYEEFLIKQFLEMMNYFQEIISSEDPVNTKSKKTNSAESLLSLAEKLDKINDVQNKEELCRLILEHAVEKTKENNNQPRLSDITNLQKKYLDIGNINFNKYLTEALKSLLEHAVDKTEENNNQPRLNDITNLQKKYSKIVNINFDNYLAEALKNLLEHAVKKTKENNNQAWLSYITNLQKKYPNVENVDFDNYLAEAKKYLNN